jgi:hypothetical protein
VLRRREEAGTTTKGEGVARDELAAEFDEDGRQIWTGVQRRV